MMRENAYINVEIAFRKTADGEEVAVMSVEKCPGLGAMGYDFDTSFRIAEAYAKLGKSLAGLVLKVL
jgi:hypothetical protein